MRRLLRYLNPLHHLGDTRYSYLFPLFTNLSVFILSEVYSYMVTNEPTDVGMYIIFISVALIIYFSFRDAILGGFISSGSAILYYFYIIYTRHYTGQQLLSGVETTLILGVLYFLLAGIIGWLKQRIDKLIERESDEKRRLETIIAQLPVGVLITDETGKLVQRNKQVDAILGVKIPLGFKIGRDTLIKEKVNGGPVNPSESPLALALKTGRPVIGRELLYHRRDGKTVSLNISSAPIHNKKRKIIAAAAIISDITKQKELEKQKDEFLGIASHELKTPVTSIKAYGQVLQTMFKRKGDTKAVEQLQKMDMQINKLTNLIGDLLDVTKIRSGRLEFHEEFFDFNELVREIVEELQITTEHHKIVTKLAQTKKIYADRERIGQVLINLITNAIKYSPQSDKIIVTTTSDAQNVGLSVKDFGVGISKDKQHKVFEQFYRVSGEKQHTFPGLGLGLYISSEIIKREGGKIWVESEGKGARLPASRQGSTFCFSLPINKKK